MDTYEKKYKELVSKIKKAYLYAQTDSTKAVLEDILPELKDNDDRIRKALITYFQRFPYPYGGIESAGTNAKEAIAWLEKQQSVEEIVERYKTSWYNEGKIAGMAEGLSDDEKYQQGWHDAIEKQGEKPQGKTALEAVKEEKVDNANKVEPKFKVGDWITDGYLHCKISDVLDDRYIVDTKFTKRSAIPFKRENEYHLWTIEDAKDGDVLCGFPEDDYPWIGIFHNLNDNDSFNSYCYLQAGVYGKFCPPSGKNIFGKRNVDEHSSYPVVPATKEQRNKLLKVMTDAGWQFDFEKKELKKVENEIEVPFSVKDSELKEENYYIPKGFYAEIDDDKVVIKKGKKPTAWSEEDEKNLTRAILYVENPALRVKDTMLSEWLKSIKERVQPQPKQWKEVRNEEL